MMRSARLAVALESIVKAGGFDAIAEWDQVWLSDERIGVIPFFGTSRMVESHVPFTVDYGRERMFNSHDGHGNPGLADPGRGVRGVPTIYDKGVHGFGASYNYSDRPGDISAPQTFFAWEGGSIADFSERWLSSAPSHHHAAAYGKLSSVLSAAGRMVGVGAVQIRSSAFPGQFQ